MNYITDISVPNSANIVKLSSFVEQLDLKGITTITPRLSKIKCIIKSCSLTYAIQSPHDTILTDLYTFITARIFSTWLLYYSYYRQLQFAFGNWNATALDIALCIYWFAYSSSLRVSISYHMSHRVDPSSSHRKYNLWRNTDLKQSLRLLYHRIRRSNCQSWKSSSSSETFASQNTALWIAIR